MNARLEAVLADIDAANAADPRREGADGGSHPVEWLYGRRMSEMLAAFAPDAGELLRIAARGQHIERWTSPRSAYEDGRIGYLRWRHDLKAYHGRRVGEIMAAHGYDAGDIDRVGAILRKENLARDAEAATLEDIACLVFLRHYLAGFMADRSADSLGDILAKSWGKMTPRGRDHALTLDLPAGAVEALQAGLARQPQRAARA